MRCRLLSVLMIAALALLFTSCKKGEPQAALSNKKAEPQAALPNKKSEPQTTLPKGYGVLNVLVEDEDGKPIEGAEIRIANKKNETFITKSRKDGSSKGAGLVSENPFMLTVMLTGYEVQQQQGITLSEVEPVLIAVKLKRSSK